MTSAAVLQALGRRWYVMVAGLMLSALVFVSMDRATDVYSTQTNVVFVAPGDKSIGQINDGKVEALIDFAAAVERVVQVGRPAERLASESATLFGAGVSQGYQVSLPNSGGQWENSFSQPVLKVEVVGPSPEWVRTTQNELLDRVDAIARDRQAQSDVASENTITTERVPATAQIQSLGSSGSARTRALAALLALGISLSTIAAVILDRAAGRHRPLDDRDTNINQRPRMAGSRRGRAS